MQHLVFGVYRFLGLHLCGHLLDTGNEVIGLDWSLESREVDEKKALFDRNANYSYYENKHVENKKVKLYISLYDYLDNPSYSTEQLRELLAYIDSFIKESKAQVEEIVLFMPEEVTKSGFDCIFSEWKIKMEQNHVFRTIHISEIYGPWLPDYKLLMKVFKKDYAVLKANMSNYIYVDDFFESFPEIMTAQDKELHITGKQSSHWRKDLLEYMECDADDLPEHGVSSDNTAKMYIGAKTSLKKGIEILEEHQSKLEMLRKWNT